MKKYTLYYKIFVVWPNADVLEEIIDVQIDKYEYIDRYDNIGAIVYNNMSTRRHANHFFSMRVPLQNQTP
jgi:hypothetical protein